MARLQTFGAVIEAQLPLAHSVLIWHIAPYFPFSMQPAEPSQVSFAMQVEGVSSTPAGNGVHVPTLPGWLHATHEPAHGVLQQMPSAHLPLAQSAPLLAGMQAPPMHALTQPPPQSTSVSPSFCTASWQ